MNRVPVINGPTVESGTLQVSTHPAWDILDAFGPWQAFPREARAGAFRYNQPAELAMWWFKQQDGSRKSALEPLGALEGELMEQIWLRGETSVRDLHGRFAARLAYTTIMTTLDRLYKKGLLARRRVGKAYVYAAKLTEKDYRARVAQHLINLALHDGRHRNAVLSCFVDAVSEADQQMLQRLGQLVKAKRRALRRPEAR